MLAAGYCAARLPRNHKTAKEFIEFVEFVEFVGFVEIDGDSLRQMETGRVR
jgi:hypothetical protein